MIPSIPKDPEHVILYLKSTGKGIKLDKALKMIVSPENTVIFSAFPTSRLIAQTSSSVPDILIKIKLNF